MKLNEKIYLCRKKAGLSQDALAERLGEETLNDQPHAQRIGVVTVDDERVAGCFGALRAVVVGDVACDGVADAFVGDVEITPHGCRGGDIIAVVGPFEVVLHAIGQ